MGLCAVFDWKRRLQSITYPGDIWLAVAGNISPFRATTVFTFPPIGGGMVITRCVTNQAPKVGSVQTLDIKEETGQ